MTPVDLEAVRRRAMEGDGDAQMALARAFDHEGRHDVALQWLQRAADGGHLPSLTMLGARLLTGRGGPQMPSQGAQMLKAAAGEGDAQACSIMATLTAAGVTQTQSWSGALDYLFRAAELGDWRARQQIALLTNNGGLSQRLLDPVAAPPWAEARAAIDMGAWLRPTPYKQFSNAPRIATYDGFLPVSVCQWIIELARPRLEAARVHNAHTGMRATDSYRTNSGMGFTLLDTDVVLQIVHARIAAASGIPRSHHEPTNVLHYAVGQEYKPHFDFLDPSVPHFTEQVAREGQRIGTFLIYLNEEFDGGGTAFPRIDWTFKGRTGDALFFLNIDAFGQLDPLTLHAGLAPTRGEKWLLSKWMRDRPRQVL